MKRFTLTLAIFALVLTTAACKNLSQPLNVGSKPEQSTDGEGSVAGPAPSFAQFSDIPIPDNAVMNLERTLLLGSEQSWIGRLSISAPYSASNLFDFYMQEMVRFGWQEITVIRSQTSVLTFKRDNRVATIQLVQESDNKTDVLFTVSPEGRPNMGSGSSASGGQTRW